MEPLAGGAPRILILESDAKLRATLLRYAVKGWQDTAVQSMGATLADIVIDSERLRSFDVLLVGCDFAQDGSADSATLRALRAISADPANPAVILLTTKGSEYTAVQAIKSGAFDYIPKALLGREQIVSAVQRAMLHRKGPIGDRDGNVRGVLRLFGYDMRRCLANRENVSVHVAFGAERRKEVVLKVLHRGPGSLSRDRNFERFVDEFKLLYDINDPAVPEIYDFRVTSQYCYIAMEYFALGHLGGKLGQAATPADALKNVAEIAHALSIIHGAGIVHRDLKPGNIMLRDNGTVALIDFGISRSAHVNREGADGGGPITGTPYYMSPEQARGASTDERTDIYALGVILYQMLTGEKPYAGDTPEAILEQHCNTPVPRLARGLALYQPLLDRMLAKDAAQRLASARELLEAIDSLAAAAEADADSAEALSA
ncbi:MAG TPA: protein kinase [Gammaproteobacteria bacterium]|nr:protein kinase [Gammaproteobacteria bacterium]